MSFILPNLDNSKQSSTINLQSARETARDSLLRFKLTVFQEIPLRDYIIKGLLKNKPKYSLEGTYERLLNFDEKFAALNKFGGAVFGKNLGLTKTWSRKQYTGGSYLGISLQTRIMDVMDGKTLISSVQSQTSRLVSLCNPKSLFKSNDNKIKELAKQAEKEGQSSNVYKLASGLLTGSSTPPEVKLEISNYFKMSGFYVKSVSFEFSHEQSTNGPLYSDVEMELIQSEIRPAGEIETAFAIQTAKEDK